ncbi:MAG: UDP-N-acetyl-alpha-D-muramoyl-L-alanyl-L-glutamate epimerase [Pseudomonadota bacterium]|uniref:UDP-N-acetyl-alpha-D-muramoyl-L-alanyl-L- glutamate epimerase n=1 Tax=Thermomonas sp. S9 TaxID=2885203 RepID=UPI00216B0CE0|nr:UDP-N-acetyl-alpha-D-muramoyl-L-alanyl-L-glutamate epimerase [Thermomonas sp. S9]
MTDWTFHRDAIRTFRFVRCGFDAQTGVAQLVYAFDDGPELVETVTVPGAPFALDGARAAAVQRALHLLHLIAGVSYYKAAVPGEIRIEGAPIDAATAALLERVYRNGLGEFAYRNGLDLRDRLRFPAEDAPTPAAPALGLRPHALVAIGGGKDSLVSIEALRAEGVAQTVTWIGGSQLIAACAAHTGLPTLNIGRQLAPQLFEFNRQGAWNGHIPVTAVNSAILALAALVLGVDQVVFSNERSASYGSLIPGTGEVNHQWSKGWAFESAFGDHLQSHVAADLHYYSLLRPLSELAVARQFAKTDRYDAHFSSCNRNFHILGERPTSRWCGVCPKCHFVFLALAPFMPKPRLVGIVGRNLLDDPAQIPGFDALLEYQDHKPFECVGEGRESRAAMAALAQRPDWREDAVVRRFAREILPQLDAAELAIEPLLVPAGEHRIPAALWERLRVRFAA